MREGRAVRPMASAPRVVRCSGKTSNLSLGAQRAEETAKGEEIVSEWPVRRHSPPSNAGRSPPREGCVGRSSPPARVACRGGPMAVALPPVGSTLEGGIRKVALTRVRSVQRDA